MKQILQKQLLSVSFALAVFLNVCGAANPLENYESLMKQGQEGSALTELKSMEKISSDYEWGLLESAKIHYRMEHWSEFFGLAYFARNAMPESEVQQEFKILETLALMRHCQFEKATAVARLVNKNKIPKRYATAMKVIENLLGSASEATLEEKPSDKSERPNSFFRSQTHWKMQLTKADVGQVDPYRLQLPVEPLCEGGE